MNFVTLVVASLLFLLVFGGGYAAWTDSTFTVTQMQKKGFRRGLPWIWHGGMIGDLILINPLCIVGVSRYGHLWSVRQWVLTGVASLGVSSMLHILYAKDPLPGTHAYRGMLTASGWIHLLYMALAFQIAALLFFYTPGIDRSFLIAASAILTVHVFFGTLCPLKMWNPEWFGVPFKLSDLAQPVGVGFLTFAVTFYKTRS